jgi:hypothetical protein
LCVACQTRGMNAYLTKIGPSPLRFSASGGVLMSFVLPASLADKQTPTNATETHSPATTSTTTNDFPVQGPPVPTPTSNPITLTTTAPPATTAPTAPASDMLVVSPQMLTEFFKPVADGTNSPGTVVVPVQVPVGFTPPSATPQSRATYHSP